MVETRIDELLNTVKAGLEELYGERLDSVHLFGSHARGEANAESDIDLLIVLDEIGDYVPEIDRTSELIASLALQYEVSISRVFVSRSDWQQASGPFLLNVRQDAIAG